MKLRLFIISALFAPLPLLASGYQLVWEDNFDGTTINPNYWNLEENARGGGNAEMQYYTPKNATIEKHPSSGESCLVISAIKENYKNRPATSARLNTQDKVVVQYGKIEARIQFPHTANGLWPAFWMLGNDLIRDMGDDDSSDHHPQYHKNGSVAWPKCGEIDIVEMGHKDGITNGTQDRYFNGACHWGESFNNGKYPNMGKSSVAPYAIQGDFHLFTLIWTPNEITMYLDQDKYPNAKPYFSLSLKGKCKNQPGHYFNKPFYLVLNLSVGGYFTGLPAPEKYAKLITDDWENFVKITDTALPKDGTPVKMYVDYIRIYQQGTKNDKIIKP